MKDWSTKTFDRINLSNVPLADDFNSDFNESENVVKPFFTLKESVDTQMVDSIDALVKQRFYIDLGDTNSLMLVRTAMGSVIESITDGMVLFFRTLHVNTGPVVASIFNYAGKPVKNDGNDLEAGYLNTSDIFMLIYSASTDTFSIFNMTKAETFNGSPTVRYQVADGVNNNDAVNVSQLTTKLKKTDILDVTNSTAIDKVGSANVGRALKAQLDSLNSRLTSNDVSLDTLQEIVNYIKDNKNGLDNLAISAISGLQTALDEKAPAVHNHDDRYYTKAETNTMLDGKALLTGSITQRFKAKNGVDLKDAVTLAQLNNQTGGELWNYKEVTNPLVTTNPATLGATWLNMLTGEIFMCTDITTDDNIWKGTNGTVVGIPTSNVVDVLEDNSAVGLYQLDGDANDSGGTNNLVNYNAVPFSTTFKFGTHSAYFNQIQGMLSLSGPTVRSVSLWYKFEGYSGNDNAIITGGNGINLILREDGNRTLFTNNGVVYVDGVQATVMPNDGAWHHYVLINDVDATLVAFGNKASGVTADNCAGGWIDQIRLFNRVLTQSEIETLRNEV